jgi:hypothetical protein
LFPKPHPPLNMTEDVSYLRSSFIQITIEVPNNLNEQLSRN